MPAELPRFSPDWLGPFDPSKRELFHETIKIVGTAGIIYSAPWLLTGCGDEDKEKQKEEGLKIPERTFNPKFRSWIEEPGLPEIKELGVSGFLFARGTWNKRSVVLADVEKGAIREVNLPTNVEGVYDVKFSPDGTKLAILAHSRSKVPIYSIQHAFVFDMESNSLKKILEQTVEFPNGSLKWSPNGELLMVNSFPGEEPLPPRYPLGPMGNIPFYTSVINVETGKSLYGIKGAIGIDFSPDSNWILTQSRQLQFSVVNVGGQEKRIPLSPMGNFTGFDWAPGGKVSQVFALMCDSTRDFRNSEVCEGGTIFSVNLESGDQSRIKLGELANLSSFVASPDGNYLLLTREDKRGKIIILNLASGGTTEVDVRDFSFGSRNFYARHFIFTGNNELRFSEHNSRGGFDIYSLRLPQGIVQKLGTVDPENGYVGLSSFIDQETMWYTVDNTTGRSPSIKVYIYSVVAGEKTFLGELNSFYDRFDVYPARLKVNEDSLVETKKGSFWIHGGRRYATNSGAFSLVGTTARQLPFSSIEKFPESVNKLDFGNGDILEMGGRVWYLQNGGRYEVAESPESFAQRRFKNFKTQEVPKWIVDKIKINENPPSSFTDQYGREVDATSPRLVALMVGLGSTADEVPKTFAKVIRGLKLIGWRDNQIVLVSHRVGRDVKGNLVPSKYEKEDARSPTESRQNCSLFMEWLSINAPLSQLVGCGHSMGGDAIFNSAVVRPDIFCMVVTINSPLTGTNKNLSVSVEDLGAFGCDKNVVLADKCEAIQFYQAAGESQTYYQNVENGASRIRNQGVDLFTFSAVRDPVVSTPRAVLQNSNDRIGNYQVQLRWDWAKDYKWEGEVDLFGSVHGLILEYDPFIAELLRVIGRP